jgi:hypothetical protein
MGKRIYNSTLARYNGQSYSHARPLGGGEETLGWACSPVIARVVHYLLALSFTDAFRFSGWRSLLTFTYSQF